MANSDVQRDYLPPLDPRTSITEADRPAIFAAVKRRLHDILYGPGSYFPDGVQVTDPTTRLQRIGQLMGSIDAMRQNSVNDPDGVLTSVYDELDRLHKSVSAAIDNQDRAIVLDEDATPKTRDRNEIYVGREPGPYLPSPLKPANPNSSRNASLQTLAPDLSRWSPLGGSGDIPPAPLARMAQPVAPVENLTRQALRMKGVPDADIGAAINDPARMKELLNQLYRRPSMTAPGEDGIGSIDPAIGNTFADRANRTPAVSNDHLPFGWSGLVALRR